MTANLETIAERVIAAANLPDVEVSVVFVSDNEIKALNKQWRNKNHATDVLSFSAFEGEPMPGTEHILGDLVISTETAKRQADELGHTLEEEVAVLTAHGIMHLLGYDHERGNDEARMQAECEMAILDCAGYDPSLALIARSLTQVKFNGTAVQGR